MSKRTPLLKRYKAGDGFRWRLTSANGEKVAHGGESFKRKPSAAKLKWMLIRSILEARVE